MFKNLINKYNDLINGIKYVKLIFIMIRLICGIILFFIFCQINYNIFILDIQYCFLNENFILNNKKQVITWENLTYLLLNYITIILIIFLITKVNLLQIIVIFFSIIWIYKCYIFYMTDNMLLFNFVLKSSPEWWNNIDLNTYISAYINEKMNLKTKDGRYIYFGEIYYSETIELIYCKKYDLRTVNDLNLFILNRFDVNIDYSTDYWSVICFLSKVFFFRILFSYLVIIID